MIHSLLRIQLTYSSGFDHIHPCPEENVRVCRKGDCASPKRDIPAILSSAKTWCRQYRLGITCLDSFLIFSDDTALLAGKMARRKANIAAGWFHGNSLHEVSGTVSP